MKILSQSLLLGGGAANLACQSPSLVYRLPVIAGVQLPYTHELISRGLCRAFRLTPAADSTTVSGVSWKTHPPSHLMVLGHILHQVMLASCTQLCTLWSQVRCLMSLCLEFISNFSISLSFVAICLLC